MFFSSVVMYLIVRKSSLLKIPSQLNNLAMFFVPMWIYFLFGFITKADFALNPTQILITIGVALLFSYLGNVASLKSIEFAPNSGYSLVISKSYVVFTTIVAILLFNAQITTSKVIAIALIIIFSTMIMITKKTNSNINSVWLPLSFVAFFCWGMLSLTSKYLFNQNVNTFVFLSYAYLIVSMCILIESKVKKVDMSLIKKNIKLLLPIGILSTTFNLGMFEAIKVAPNVGYVNTINAASISLVTVMSVLLFRDEFNLRKTIGVFGVVIGLILMFL
jgi:drug/metabolite transporter (DMT)-like permease